MHRMKVIVDGHPYRGTGNTKKVAKVRAAVFALRAMGIETSYTPGNRGNRGN